MRTIGIDLGGTRTKIGLIDNGKITAIAEIDSNSHMGMRPILPQVANAINKLISQFPSQEKLQGVGISIPGIVDSKEMKLLTINDKFNDATEIDFRAWARENWDVPLFMDNDARCALVGEWQYGKGKGLNNVVIVTLGTGFGSSAVIDGKVLRGKHFLAGCLGGHLTLDWKGLQCNCGNTGCVEAHGSTWNLPAIANQFPEFKNSALNLCEVLDFKNIFDLANTDSAALQIRNYCMDVWATGIANLVYAYDPEIIILCGGVMHSANIIVPYIRKKLSTFAWAPFSEIKLEVSDNFNTAALLSAEYFINNI